MFRLVKIALVLLISTSSALPAIGQKAKPAKKSDVSQVTAEKEVTTEQRALAMIESVLQASAGFEDAALKAKIQFEAADLLWRFDQPRARRLYDESYHAIDGVKPPNSLRISSDFLPGFKSRLRGDLLKAASQHDRDFAESLVKSPTETRPDGKQPAVNSTRCVGCGFQIESVSQTFRMAIDAAPADPQRAVQLAKDALNRSINSMIYSVLQVLRRRHPELADDLFISAVASARQHTIYLSDSANSLAPYVFPDFGAGTRVRATPQPPVPITMRGELIEQFLSFFADAAEKEARMLQSRGPDPDDSQIKRRLSLDYFLGELMLPYFERHMPDRVAAVRVHIDEIVGALPAGEAKPYLDDFKRENTAAEIAEKADIEKDAGRQQDYYLQAVFQANARREFDDALATATKITDETARSFAESVVRYDMTFWTLSKADPAAAYKLAHEVADPVKRGSLLVQLSLFTREGLAPSAQILAEAEETLYTAENSTEKASEMLRLAAVAAKLDLARGFDDLKAAIVVLNASALPHQWGTYEAVISKSTGKMFTTKYTGLELLRFGPVVERLARIDFARTLQIARGIQSSEASVLAQLAICRAVLEAPNSSR
ncbi:MAG TPA: hypothetical protein VN937_22970 [Blastocatellia bacterium]|nr:hypothetical protein [Blastocatellia bacterium]